MALFVVFSGQEKAVNTLELIGVEPSVEIELRKVPFSSVERLAKRLGVERSTILDLMGVPDRTRARRRHEGVLKADEADRLLRVARVFGEAIRVFGSEGKAALWLKTPSPLFEDSAPLSYLDSDAGAHVVSEEIVRIDFGDFA
jgi:putative toxin-antitoxin system antitoxin component (TIGR02293 family)